MHQNTTKTRIIYVITKSNFGGAQKYVYELATALDKEIFDVSVALGGSGILKDKLEDAGIRVITIPHLERDISLFKELKVFKFLLSLFKKEKPDVVHLNSSKIGGTGSLAARLTGVPKIIFTAHGWAFNESRSFISKAVIKFLYWITIILSDKTIAVSESIRNRVIGWPLIRDKLVIIWNGVKQIEFLDRESARSGLAELDSRTSFGVGNDNARWIGTLAELHPIKGLDILIDAAKEVVKTHSDVQFIVMGPGELRDDLERQIRKNKLEKNFFLLGYVEEAAKYLKAFDLFVLPSRSEALSLAILEAGLAELPVIATRVGGIPEIIMSQSAQLPGIPSAPASVTGVQKTNFGILVEKEDSGALTAAINTLLEDKSKAQNMTQNLYQRVHNEFGYKKMLRSTIDLYR